MMDEYDTVNHILLIHNTTQNSALCRVIQNLLSDRRLYVELNNERSRWRLQKNGLPQGSVTFPIFNIHTNDQPVHDGTRSFIYADDLCITAQYSTFSQVESTIKEPLSELIGYYRKTVCVPILTRSKNRRIWCSSMGEIFTRRHTGPRSK